MPVSLGRVERLKHSDHAGKSENGRRCAASTSTAGARFGDRQITRTSARDSAAIANQKHPEENKEYDQRKMGFDHESCGL